MQQSDINERAERIASSALWAAYGDALGFPTELADIGAVKRRIGTARVSKTVAWKRRVGGRFGVDVEIPAGGYSDDTQLRLATSRAIRGDGVFDVETFAKVELPVWLSYCLGAGRGSKAAAANLANRKINWFSNFFSSSGAEYLNGGGNGAAMRIQPHVWASPNYINWRSFLPQVAKNAVCTHGHMRGIGGALVHAMSLAYVLENGKPPKISEWVNFGNSIRLFLEIVESDPDLAQFWLPVWEERGGIRLSMAVDEVVSEWEFACETIESLDIGEPDALYIRALETLGGMTERERGSGLKSALFALLVANMAPKMGGHGAITLAANVLSSDTDTIASMAGALIGACRGQARPSDPIQDDWYIELEAERCFSISESNDVVTFTYPDLLYWNPPKSPLDAVGIVSGQLAISGLGRLSPVEEKKRYETRDSIWSWCTLPFGQSVLCKFRKELRELDKRGLPKTALVQKRASKIVDLGSTVAIPDLFEEKDSSKNSSYLDDLVNDAIRSNFDPLLIGKHISDLSQRGNGLELSIGYVAIVVKAKMARAKSKPKG